jgi:shikimate dehydrogenase
LTDLDVALGADVVVSTLPADGGAAWAGQLADDVRRRGAKPAGVLLDVVYHPWPTVAAAAWDAAGGAAIGGFAMLLHQAAAQVRLMTGAQAPVAAMRPPARRSWTGGWPPSSDHAASRGDHRYAVRVSPDVESSTACGHRSTGRR